MTGLPEFGEKVTVWPSPGRLVQDGPRPVDSMGGGRWLPKEGKEVSWSPFLLEQYRAGDLLLHGPDEDEGNAKLPEPPKVDKPAPKAEEKPAIAKDKR